jgi:hypothetical protein
MRRVGREKPKEMKAIARELSDSDPEMGEGCSTDEEEGCFERCL